MDNPDSNDLPKLDSSFEQTQKHMTPNTQTYSPSNNQSQPQNNSQQPKENLNKSKLHKFVFIYGVLYWIFVLIFVIFAVFIILESQKPNNSDVGFALALPGIIYLPISLMYLILLIIVSISKKSSESQKKNAILLIFAVVTPSLALIAFAFLSG